MALAVVLLYLTLRGLDWSAFWKALKNGHYGFLLLTMPIAPLSYFIRAVRWRILVRSEVDVPLRIVFWANMVGYMGNAYLPARAGELLRSAFLGQEKGLGTSFVLATALTERILDAVALVLIGSVAFLTQGQVPSTLANAVRVVALAGFLGLVLLVAAPFQERLVLHVLAKLPLRPRLSAVVSEQVTRFLAGMRPLQNGRRLGAFIALLAVIWLVDAIGTMVGVHIVSQTLSLAQALILLAALGLSSAVPSTPGYIGVYQFAAVSVLVPFGFSRADALAYILSSQVMNYLVVSSWGLIGLWQINPHKELTSPSND